MESAAKERTVYEFDGFQLVPDEDLLLRNGERIALTIKSFSVLKMLVERHGHLVTKSEIIDKVWEDAFVEEGSLTKSVWLIRQALGDTSKERYIQTVQRRGYRFVFPVSVMTDLSGAYRVSDLTGINDGRAESISVSEASSTNGGAGVARSADMNSTNHWVDQPPIALTDFAQSDNGRNNEQSSPPKTPLFRRLQSPAAYAGIGVVIVLALGLYFALSSRSIGKSDPTRDRGTKNEEAYRLYQQAENLTQRRLPKDMQAALNYVNQAITLDPKFARAWAYKAHLHAYLAQYPGVDENEEYRKSMDAIAKALEIDPYASVAYSVRCHNKAHYEYDFAGAEIDCKRALELDPDSAIGHQRYSSFLRSRGRFDEAITEAKRAVDLQPISFDSQQNYAITLRFARRYEEEEAEWKLLLEQNSGHSLIYTRLFTNLAQQGKYDKAFEYLIKRLTEVDKADNETVERFRSAYATSGWRGVTMERIKHLDLESMNGPVDVAFLYVGLGDKDKAFEYLEQAYKERNSRIASLQIEPQLDPLRDDPRFADLLRRIGEK